MGMKKCLSEVVGSMSRPQFGTHLQTASLSRGGLTTILLSVLVSKSDYVGLY